MLANLKRPPSVSELEARFARTPSIANRISLAQGLCDADRYDTACGHFEKALAQSDTDKDALYGIGVCHLELDRHDKSIEALQQLIDLHRGYRDYAAWGVLAEAFYESGDKKACHELLRELVRTSPRVQHHVARAQFLKKDGRSAEAIAILEDALAEELHQPRHAKRANRPHVRQANKLLRELNDAGADEGRVT